MFWDRVTSIVLVALLTIGTLGIGYVRSQTPGVFVEGNILTAAQLNAALAVKTDYPLTVGGVSVSGPASSGYVPIATNSTAATWGTTFPAFMTFGLGFTTAEFNGVPSNMDPFTITTNLFGEFRFEDNGSEGASFGTIYNPGSGYGGTLTGIVSPATGCSVPPQFSVTTNSGGQVIIINNGGVPIVEGVCGNGDNFPSSTTPWNVISGLNAGTDLEILLVPMVFSGFGGHCASDSTRVVSTDLTNDTGPRFYIGCAGVAVYGPGDGTLDLSTLRCGVGIYCVNGQVDLFSMVASVVAPTVGAGQIGYGGTTISAGSGTCPSGTIGGQTVQGCIVTNIAGTSRNVPFF